MSNRNNKRGVLGLFKRIAEGIDDGIGNWLLDKEERAADSEDCEVYADDEQGYGAHEHCIICGNYLDTSHWDKSEVVDVYICEECMSSFPKDYIEYRIDCYKKHLYYNEFDILMDRLEMGGNADLSKYRLEGYYLLSHVHEHESKDKKREEHEE